ncbi:MAG: molybdenum cofactor biosynthesis protein MoeB [Saprospiraceae bacterium]|nr:MAG: molybdenum cofactor biosynthesis protein MoeB [Saprospiraceae bacterium]
MNGLDNFSQEELARYARHFAIPEFGIAGQGKLKAARVLVIGAGGLGSPLLLYLAAAGVGHLGIVEFDRVDASNLQRQVLYRVSDIGKNKSEIAKTQLLALNPHISVETYNVALTRENAIELISKYDIVADGTDNFQTRYLVNDACVLCEKINVYASIFRFEGQVSVFNYPHKDGSRGPNYRDIFPEPPPPDLVPNCAEGGVLGVLPGIIGSLQASEVIKVITGIGEPLAGRLFLFDAAAFSSRILKFGKRPDTKIETLIDYDQFCGVHTSKPTDIKTIDPLELQQLLDTTESFSIIDVREPYEFGIGNLGGQLIPLGQIIENAEKIPNNQKVVLICRSGRRSAKAIRQLQEQYNMKNLFNLEGGLLAWRDAVDGGMEV